MNKSKTRNLDIELDFVLDLKLDNTPQPIFTAE